MNRPVIIVNPLSSGVELAPAFKARGIPAIALIFKYLGRIGFGMEIQTADFIEIIPDQPKGHIANVDVLAKISKLPTLFREYIWVKEGDHVSQTVDYLTSIGIIALSGDRKRPQVNCIRLRKN